MPLPCSRLVTEGVSVTSSPVKVLSKLRKSSAELTTGTKGGWMALASRAFQSIVAKNGCAFTSSASRSEEPRRFCGYKVPLELTLMHSSLLSRSFAFSEKFGRISTGFYSCGRTLPRLCSGAVLACSCSRMEADHTASRIPGHPKRVGWKRVRSSTSRRRGHVRLL